MTGSRYRGRCGSPVGARAGGGFRTGILAGHVPGVAERPYTVTGVR